MKLWAWAHRKLSGRGELGHGLCRLVSTAGLVMAMKVVRWLGFCGYVELTNAKC